MDVSNFASCKVNLHPKIPSPSRPSLTTRISSTPLSSLAAGLLSILSSRSLCNFSIWHYKITRNNRTIVWSANSLVNSNSSLVIDDSNELRLTNSSGRHLLPRVVSSNPNSTRPVLEDEGNPVYGNWASFDHPTDKILPNQTMKASGIMHLENKKFNFLNYQSLIFYSSQYWSINNAFQSLDKSGMVHQANEATLISLDFGDQSIIQRLKSGMVPNG